MFEQFLFLLRNFYYTLNALRNSFRNLRISFCCAIFCFQNKPITVKQPSSAIIIALSGSMLVMFLFYKQNVAQQKEIRRLRNELRKAFKV